MAEKVRITTCMILILQCFYISAETFVGFCRGPAIFFYQLDSRLVHKTERISTKWIDRNLKKILPILGTG